MHRKNSAGQIISHIVIIILLFLSLYPLILMLIKSVKTIDQEIHHGFALTFPFNWSNYSLAWKYVSGYILNTFLISILNTVGILLATSTMAYGFTRYDFRGKNSLFMAVLALTMIPGILPMIWINP